LEDRTSSGGASRPIDALLAGYAAGSLDPYLHALIASHLILSDQNRDFVWMLEEAAGAELEQMPAPAPDPAARDKALARILAEGPSHAPFPAHDDPDVPAPLARLLGAPLRDIPWRMVTPGMKEHRIAENGGFEATMFKIRPSVAMPVHAHEGSEVTLVLKGSFSDGRGHYRRGDVAIADSAVVHRPVAGPDEECVCFVVLDAPYRLTGPIGRVIERLFRN
jgi:putative transcriptional regulator